MIVELHNAHQLPEVEHPGCVLGLSWDQFAPQRLTSLSRTFESFHLLKQEGVARPRLYLIRYSQNATVEGVIEQNSFNKPNAPVELLPKAFGVYLH